MPDRPHRDEQRTRRLALFPRGVPLVTPGLTRGPGPRIGTVALGPGSPLRSGRGDGWAIVRIHTSPALRHIGAARLSGGKA